VRFSLPYISLRIPGRELAGISSIVICAIRW
jgi:hypothetical protein